jgi:hypothetical protein
MPSTTQLKLELSMPDREKDTLDAMRDLVKTVTGLTPAEQERMEATIKNYDKEFQECRNIFLDRNKIYKNTFEHLGLIGTVITLIGDTYRLKNMIVNEPDHGRQYKEQIIDKLEDVVNQALISLMMIKQDNYEGK